MNDLMQTIILDKSLYCLRRIWHTYFEIIVLYASCSVSINQTTLLRINIPLMTPCSVAEMLSVVLISL